MYVGELIAYRRGLLGISRYKLGILAGYQPSLASYTVGRWEKGLSVIPTEKLRKVASALELPLDQLIPKEDDPSVRARPRRKRGKSPKTSKA